jgi:hypothetical protein
MTNGLTVVRQTTDPYGDRIPCMRSARPYEKAHAPDFPDDPMRHKGFPKSWQFMANGDVCLAP